MEKENKITLTQALKEGYTHFMMASNYGQKSEFAIYPLTVNDLTTCLSRSQDCEFDYSFDDEEGMFGEKPYLCDKPQYSNLGLEELSSIIEDLFCEDEWMLEHLMDKMTKELKDDEDFKKGVELINKALSQYKSYTDTDIEVVLDEEAIVNAQQASLND